MKNSALFSVSVRDLVKGFLVAVLTVFLAGITTSLNEGRLPEMPELKNLALMGLASGVAYLCKNFFTNSKDQFVKSEPKDNEYK